MCCVSLIFFLAFVLFFFSRKSKCKQQFESIKEILQSNTHSLLTLGNTNLFLMVGQIMLEIYLWNFYDFFFVKFLKEFFVNYNCIKEIKMNFTDFKNVYWSLESSNLHQRLYRLSAIPWASVIPSNSTKIFKYIQGPQITFFSLEND